MLVINQRYKESYFKIKGYDMVIDLEAIYTNYMDAKNEENRKARYEGKENYYSGSSSGFCSRKNYYKVVLKSEPTNLPQPRNKRVMRLGTVWHDDLDKAILSIPKEDYWMYNIKEIKTEEEVCIERFKVRGHYDALFITNQDEHLLYDFKTIGSWGWRNQFPNNGMDKVKIKHELQLGTYGLAIKEQYGRIDGLYLLYYNKDNSEMKEVSVPLSRIDDAIEYWTSINIEHSEGLPEINNGVSPVEKWECNYCDWLDLCKQQSKGITINAK